ncbi:IS30 family transposase [Pseudonocardia sp. KRD-184]|uniref:IS30 family transposase n=1 Tax=Pseudonocardia oceani TaxID=2792013 RepID=A0ABS6U2S8_9PSEU|nr:helix-turn-helix domain-containing protein [Pseudonocardia oceani]MBW0089278.1 IS30 family transposase [Pseudonocardia oceani]MBW0094967.1 IS30 family transposase [Pseudonocardia oceani]MBW0107799.1 IS30 family transposase [Pseudonocardia oceani]MBW0121478.1 IS30 family transposase [Pseudonocardia oceani]MBW0126466.1 IS30 family transposase [Pseudonocardia oceani]
MRVADSARSNRYLSLLERQRIATLRAQGVGVREIARRIERAASTVSRELHRNLLRHDYNVYDADLAHARARQRARRVRRTRLIRDPELRRLVQAKLELEWSPEQIAAHLRIAHPDCRDWHLCHETIHQGLYHGGKGGLSRNSPAGCGPGDRYGSDVAEPTSGRPGSSRRRRSSTATRRGRGARTDRGLGR